MSSSDRIGQGAFEGDPGTGLPLAAESLDKGDPGTGLPLAADMQSIEGDPGTGLPLVSDSGD
jgi:hypothetical protein